MSDALEITSRLLASIVRVNKLTKLESNRGWRPSKGQTDKNGVLIEDRVYNQIDMDRTLVLEKRTELVAKKITEFLEATDPYAKTIVFCDDSACAYDFSL
jgi:type I site-specific restriction endonuclease